MLQRCLSGAHNVRKTDHDWEQRKTGNKNEGRYKRTPGDTFPFGYFGICRCKGIFIAKFSPDATLDQVDPLVLKQENLSKLSQNKVKKQS